ncbi:uncharacterized protein DSM5745_09869 [Aspergillus mulundensis]|uniref:Uncharacterized protein n=1 Tax=Aspergillus mulundensis TaxID=1810919 RepID=A0A3D8QS06_9EURO|nr:hypothetical protein DSM5745_09869 [Aspergillus mulundensis]RDW64458.1 hypothetical protein DSM5745_09869 [Aspergillus mulundensis]
MQRLDAYNTWNRINRRQDTEKLWTTAALLADLGLAPTYGHGPSQHNQRLLAQDRDGEESSRGAWTFPPETPPPFFPSFEIPAGAQDVCSDVWAPPSPPADTEATTAWALASKRWRWQPQQWVYFHHVASAISTDRLPPSHPLADFKPCRRLGVYIWDSWRMYRLGLCEGVRGSGGIVPTPDGDSYGPSTGEPGGVDYWARWVALIGKM